LRRQNAIVFYKGLCEDVNKTQLARKCIFEQTEMPARDGGKSAKSFSDLLRIPWVKSSIILGTVLVAVGLIALFLFKTLDIGKLQLFSDLRAFIADYGFVGIFFATILAGTIVPLGSPALVAAAALFGMPLLPLVLIATTGFTIGMTINYGLAYYLGRPYVLNKVAAKKLEEMTQLWNRWGWILYTIFGLIPVLPVELLSFVCGLLRTRLVVFLTLSFAPRFMVFTVLALFGEQAGMWAGIT